MAMTQEELAALEAAAKKTREANAGIARRRGSHGGGFGSIKPDPEEKIFKANHRKNDAPLAIAAESSLVAE